MAAASAQTYELEVLSPNSFKAELEKTPEQRTPCIIRGLDTGPCTSKWNDVEYLKKIVGKDKNVVTHVSPSNQMDFLQKNFKYRTLRFGDLIDRCGRSKQPEPFLTETESYYLRSVGEDQRRQVASIAVDFPLLWSDIIIPDFIPIDRMFSSVFRMSSSSAQLWTHYDVMDNILVQVVGRKKVVLFAPSDVPYLYLSGDKSQVLNIDSPDFSKYPSFSKATHYKGVLETADVLYIPALWFHNTTALEFCVNVNIFWKDLHSKLYDAKDLYGNVDLLPAQRAQQGVQKAMATLNCLPYPYKKFYALRLIEYIKANME